MSGASGRQPARAWVGGDGLAYLDDEPWMHPWWSRWFWRAVVWARRTFNRKVRREMAYLESLERP